MTNRQVKLNINGINYKISGLDKSISYKDILCTIAKQNEVLCSKEGDVKNKAKQKQKQIDGKKAASPKSKRIPFPKEKELSEIDKLRQIKIIYVGEGSRNERLVKKRKAHGDGTNKGEAIKRAHDDSDIEVYHKSRRRMKNIMKRKWRDESDQQFYQHQVQTGAILPKVKPNQRRNQSQSRFMNEWDKISIYYLDEGPVKQNEHRVSQRKSNCGSTVGSLLSKASSASNSTKKRPQLNTLTIESNIGDDKDSGIPSLESEEISSKDDNRVDEKAYQGFADPIFFECYNNGELNKENTCLGLCMGQSKGSIAKEISRDKAEKLYPAAVAVFARRIENKKDQKWEGHHCHISKLPSEECCNEEIDNKTKNWAVTPNMVLEDDAAVASDFEIIKAEHTESATLYNKRSQEVKKFHPLENIHSSEAQQIDVVYDINSNVVQDAKTTAEKETKFNLENRGSFILIELDDSQLTGLDRGDKPKTMPKTLLKDDFHCDVMIEASQMEEKPLVLQASQYYSTRLDNRGCSETEGERVKGDKTMNRNEGKHSILKENCAGKPTIEIDDYAIQCQMDEENEEDLREETVRITYSEIHSSETDMQQSSEQNRLGGMEIVTQCKVSRHVGRREDFDSSLVSENHVDCETKRDGVNDANQCFVSDKMIRKKQEKLGEIGNEKISIKSKQDEQSQMGGSEIGLMMDGSEEEVKLLDLGVEKDSTNKYAAYFRDNFCENAYRKAINFTRKDDKLVAKFISKFARQIEVHMKTKFYNKKGAPISKDSPTLLENDKKESLIIMNSNSTRRELWTQYTNVCRNIYSLLERLFFFDLKIEQMEFELKELKELERLHDDAAWNDDENDIVKDIIEFRDFLKKVTIISRKNRSELRATQAQIEKLDLILLSKRSLLKSIDESLSSNRCQNIPRRLLRNARFKNRR